MRLAIERSPPLLEEHTTLLEKEAAPTREIKSLSRAVDRSQGWERQGLGSWGSRGSQGGSKEGYVAAREGHAAGVVG